MRLNHSSAEGGRPKLLYLVTEDWYFCSHRLAIARAAQQEGYQVAVATRVDKDGDRIRSEGIHLIPISMRRRGMAPWRELKTLLELSMIYRRERPDVVHHVAMKPVIYGAVVARLTGVPTVINALAGLGFVFVSAGLRARLLRPLIKMALRVALRGPSISNLVQNPDDIAVLKRLRVSQERITMIKGSGVDVSHFTPQPEPEGRIVISMVSRMLWDKGVGEVVESARILRACAVPVQVRLIGAPDPENPASIPEQRLREWHRDGVVEWQGYRDDVRSVWAESHIAVLPSYREGLPKSLLEAAACGRPIVTSDVPGCREIVRDGENGLLVPVNDPEALARALGRLIDDATLRHGMGERGRRLVEKEFAEPIVTRQTLDLYRDAREG